MPTFARLSTAFSTSVESTVHHYFKLWDWDGTLERIHHALYVAVREQAGREASPRWRCLRNGLEFDTSRFESSQPSQPPQSLAG
jgi:hypothetical protein